MTIVAVTGVPGTGKSEVAKLLAKRLGWKMVELNRLAERKNLYCGIDKKRGCKIVDIGKLSLELKKVSGNLVIESHYAHELGCDLVVVLRTGPKALRKRLEKRGWPEEKIEENLEAEIMGICKQEVWESGKKVIEVDTTGKGLGDVVEEIVSKIDL